MSLMSVQLEENPMTSQEIGEVFRLERRENIAVILFDVPGESVNTLKAGFEEQFDQLLTELDENQELEAVVFASGKPEGFIAGADVGMLEQIETADEATQLMRTAHVVMGRIESFRLPIVAAIHGACLGGGLELALTCTERVASHADSTRLGQSEVKLGLIPGAGGTQRLPRLIGIENALELILTGEQISAKKAISLGLVDEVVHPAILIDVACERARELAEGRKSQRENGLDLKALLLEDNPIGRRVLFNQAEERTKVRTHGNYPAPLKAIEVIRTGIEEGMQAGLEAEAKVFGELVVTPQAKRLMEIFFARNALKKDTGVDDASVEPHPVRKVAVLGAGLMGAGIAYVTAGKAGLPVRLKDVDHAALKEGMRSVRDMIDYRVKKDRINRQEGDEIMTQIHPTTDYSGFQRADVVIEAVFEDLDLKRSVLREVEENKKGEFIFASNTSSLPIRHIAESSTHPERVIGMHYFSPVQKMPLLEVVVTPETEPWVTATCVELGKRQGKTVIVVHDGPGLYTTRILGPYINEAVRILLQGVRMEKIDEALEKFGFPMGPIELLDEVGIDVVDKVSLVLHEAFGERMAPPPGMEKMTESDRLGQKSGRGFYRYDEDGRQPDGKVFKLLDVTLGAEIGEDEIVQRCALQMVNEAAYCYGENILRSARDGDIGAVFGLGFPPFLGGPFRYVDAQSVEQVVDKLKDFHQRFGERFAPAPVLTEMASNGTKFYE